MPFKLYEMLVDKGLDKIIKQLSPVSVLISLTTFGLLNYWFPLRNSAHFAFVLFGFAALIEFAYRYQYSRFDALMDEFESRKGNNTDLFFDVAWIKYKDRCKILTDKRVLGGLLFNHVMIDEELPVSIIAGPLCPDCKKLVTVRPLALFPWLIRYECLCGFKKTTRQTPDKLYERLSNYFCLPSLR